MVFQERTYSVLIVTASDSFTAKIMPLLPVTDYWPVTTVHSIGEAAPQKSRKQRLTSC